MKCTACHCTLKDSKCPNPTCARFGIGVTGTPWVGRSGMGGFPGLVADYWMKEPAFRYVQPNKTGTVAYAFADLKSVGAVTVKKNQYTYHHAAVKRLEELAGEQQA